MCAKQAKSAHLKITSARPEEPKSKINLPVKKMLSTTIKSLNILVLV